MIQATLRLPVLLLLLLGLACCVQPALAFTPTLTPRPRQVQLPRSTVAVNTSIADAPGQRIYVIFHGGSKGVNNVYSYNMSTGALLSKAVLRGDPSGSEYRSALLFNAGPGMLINVAWKEDSYLALYGACDASSGVRTFSSRFAATHLAHGYGLAAGADAATNQPSVWVSNQNTANVVQFDVQGRFLKALPAFPTGEELRGLAFNPVTGVLYVADKTQNAVKAFNTKTAAWNTSLQLSGIVKPIGLYLDTDHQLLYVGSNDKTAGIVMSFDVSPSVVAGGKPPPVKQKFVQTKWLSHPAGMLVRNGILYVLSQDTNTLLTFDANSGAFLRVLVAQFDDKVEQILLSPC